MSDEIVARLRRYFQTTTGSAVADEAAAALESLSAQLAERDAELVAIKADILAMSVTGSNMCDELAALKGHAEAMALDLEYIFQHDDASGGSEALPEYRAAYPKED